MVATDVLPEAFWTNMDDGCNCTYQRIGMWSNPYIAETLEVRLCCIWTELYKLFPQHVRTTPAFLNYNTDEWDESLLDWDGESDMPRAIWYRQLARQHGISVSEARDQYAHLDPPKGVPRPHVETEEGPSLVSLLFAQLVNLKRRVEELEAK